MLKKVNGLRNSLIAEDISPRSTTEGTIEAWLLDHWPLLLWFQYFVLYFETLTFGIICILKQKSFFLGTVW